MRWNPKEAIAEGKKVVFTQYSGSEIPKVTKYEYDDIGRQIKVISAYGTTVQAL